MLPAQSVHLPKIVWRVSRGPKGLEQINAILVHVDLFQPLRPDATKDDDVKNAFFGL